MVHEGDQIQTMQGPPRVATACSLHLQSCSSETKNHETEIWFLHCGACRLQCSGIAASAVTLFFSESEITTGAPRITRNVGRGAHMSAPPTSPNLPG